MRSSGKTTRRAVSLLLCLAVLVSMLAFALTVRAEDVDDISDTGAETYYLWGENTNSPNFNGTTPTGTFSYDSSNGYYYYDLSGSSGDYCFVISTVSNSANSAVKTPSVQTVANAGPYYLSSGNYHGFNCLHLWNPGGDAVRLYFTSASAGVNCVKAGSTTPTQAPTQKATQAPTQKATSGGGTVVNPTTPSPTQSGSDSGKTYVFCENEAGWSTVTAYMWIKDTQTSNAGWPGVAMTKVGGNTWRYEVTNSKFNMIIFSNNGSTQTADLTFPGANYKWNNKTNEWTIHDTSPLQISSFATDVESPQYNGVGINLSASAEGDGTVYYKFSVKNGSSTTVISDYSTKNQVQWIPQVVGTYTIVYDFKDAAGNTNQRTKSFTIEDGLSSVSPYIKTVSPFGGEIQNGKSVKVNVTAGGGITGTNLLFYKFTVKNSSGNIVNTPYYTLSGSYSFTPSSTGAYSVTVDVQGSDNKTIERTYNYTSVGTLTPTETPATQPPTTVKPTEKATEAPKPTTMPTTKPTEPITASKLGDADDDGDINILDVTFIQRYLAGVSLPNPLNTLNADVDGDGDVNIVDATHIQRYLAGIITKFPAQK